MAEGNCPTSTDIEEELEEIAEDKSEEQVSWSPTEESCNHASNPDVLKMMSWNIDGLSDIAFIQRTYVACKIINKLKPHVVFLQEVIEPAVPLIKTWCPSYLFHPAGEVGYFTAILTRKDAVQVEDVDIIKFLHTNMSRNLMRLRFTYRCSKFSAINTHLESMKRSRCIRINQLRLALLIAINEPSDRIVISGGDLNIRDNELAKLPKEIKDVWEMLGSDPATRYTWDLYMNDNLSFNEGPKTRFRFDRIFLRQSDKNKCTPVLFKFVGTQRIHNIEMFPSDHWGIASMFKIIK